MSILYEYLKSANLEKFFPVFEAHGVTDKSILGLTMQDYSLFGVTSMNDRKRLFQMIQVLKMDMDEGDTGKGSSSPGDEAAVDRTEENRGKNVNAKITKMTHGDLKPQQSQKGAKKTYDEDQNRNFSEPCTPVKKSSAAPLGRRQDPAKGSQFPVMDKFDSDGGGSQVASRAVSRDKNSNVGPSSAGSYNYGVAGAATASPAKPRRTDIGDRIEVCVRKRPLSKKEMRNEETDIAQMIGKNCLVITEPKIAVDLTKYEQKHEFIYDHVFDETSTNERIYNIAVRKLVKSIFYRGKATCFAYGQTGSGKTYTMMGNSKIKGLYLLAAKDIFKMLACEEYSDLSVHVGFFEIYCGQLFDLLHDRKQLYAREDHKKRVCISGLQEVEVGSAEELMQVMTHGNSSRSTGSNSTNSDSSRSHAILQIVLKTKGGKGCGKISFIDLAGSERAADTKESDKQTRLEGAEINQSLLALKECIRALDQDQKHTPFRQSKLTQVLRDSLIGQNARTCMIANISPNSNSGEHTLNTLRYAYRVKELKRVETNAVDEEEDDFFGDDSCEEAEGIMNESKDSVGAENSLEAFPNESKMSRGNPKSTLATPRQPTGASSNSDVPSPAFMVPSEIEGSYQNGLMEEEIPSMYDECTDNDIIEDIQFVKDQALSLIASHKKQLSQVTEFCKQEMKMLYDLELTVSTAPVQGGTAAASETILALGEYAESVSDVLKEKMEAIKSFRGDIDRVCTSFTGDQ
eukprot:Nk52_evm4s383 gene=Nk52_evmTU4s383